MSLVVSDVAEVLMLEFILQRTLTLKLFANDLTPTNSTVVSDFVEVTGGGYVDIDLDFNTWTITPGAPSVALYDDFQDFLFTGPTGGAGTIYGYYIVDEDNNLLWSERFPDAQVPFEPINGSLIRVRPRLTMSSSSGD